MLFLSFFELDYQFFNCCNVAIQKIILNLYLTKTQHNQKIRMQNYSEKYIAIILTEFKSSQRDLYPLSKNYPLPLFPIGNKKLIIYQLQALAKINQLDRIIIEVNQSNLMIQEYITKVFLVEFPQFYKRIQFYHTVNNQNNFLRLLAIINHINSKISTNIKGLIVSLCDTLVSLDLPEKLIRFHEKKQSDLTFLSKKKKQFNENDKKNSEAEIQTQIDNVFVGDQDQLLFIDMLDEYQNNGVNIHPSIYRRVKKGSFKKVVDSKYYVFGPNTISIIKNLNSSEIDDIKPWLIQSLVQNQTNKKLLQLNQNSQPNNYQPLNIFLCVLDQDAYIKKVNNKKIYEGVNFDSLVRGAKQKQLLLPTQFSFNSQNPDYKGNLIMKSSVIGHETRITRSCVESSCKIGKKVQILRSIIMGNVQIRDNCKIHDSIIGPQTIIGENCSILNSYLAMGCQIPDGNKVDNEIKIPLL